MSLLRVMCLHDAGSNSLDLSRKLHALGERLYQRHGIELVFVDGPLIVERDEVKRHEEDVVEDHPLRAWWETMREESSSSSDSEKKTGNESQTTEVPERTKNLPRFVGLDASLLLLKQVWTSSPFWGILAFGQASGVAAMLPLLPTTPGRPQQPPSFMIFVDGESLLDEDECLTEHLDLPCLHIVRTNASSDSKLVRQFGGEVLVEASSFSAAFHNHVGRFLVARKKDMRSSSVAVLALRHELHRTEADAAQLVARSIAQDPPDALMAVITPRDVGGFREKRRGPDEDGGGAPCPSEFLLHRTKRSTAQTKNNDNDTKSEASRHHPNQQRRGA